MIGTCVAGLLLSALAVIPDAPTKPGDMRLSQAGYELLLDYESCRLEPYKCSANKWTDGVGNTVGVKPGEKITEREAAEDLKSNVARFERAVNQAVKINIPQPVFDAFVVFSFNVGVGGFQSSTALKQLNSGNIPLACEWLLPWNKITVINERGEKVKVVSPGLDNRRRAEYAMCMQGVGL